MMDEKFSKFKKRVWTEIIVKCVCIAAFCALFTVIAVFLPCKLCGVSLLWVYYLLIGLGGGAIGGGVSFFLLRTDDRKIAKRMDRELRLEERVTTALEFSGQKSEMLEMQREDTSAALLGISAFALTASNILAIALLAVGISAGIAAIPVIKYVVPTVVAETPLPEEPVDPDRPITDWEYSALDELILYVRNSKKADKRTKDGILHELEGLKGLLANGLTESKLKVFVQNSVLEIRNVVRDANSAEGVSEEQKTNNTQEGEYVVGKLYEIFDLQSSTPDSPPSGDDDKKDGDDDDDKPSLDPSENKNELPIFDAEKGHVIFGDVSDDFFESVQQKYENGELTEEEFQSYLEYFNGLRGNNE